MSLFISNAYAQDAGGAAGGGFEMLIMLGVFGLIFYFMLYRPQAKRVKDHKNLVTSLSKEEYGNKSLVLVDDVLNSGATLIYAIKHFLDTEIKQFKTAVLVNRNHKKYPVKADFKGISLSTTTISHVKVRFKENTAEAFLT